MLVAKSRDIPFSEVTPKSSYLNRRKLLFSFPAAFLLARARAAIGLGNLVKSPLSANEKVNSFKDVSTYNNFYEFGTSKEQPAQLAKNFKTDPWMVSVEGEVAKPRTFTMEEILKLAPLEERIYRHRCVEGWSIVVPWIGSSFSTIAKLVQPTSKAQYVAFQSYYEPRQMPLGGSAGIELPYLEGLRLDEAMNPLALLC